MPLYEYRCESCQKVFEAYKRLSDDGREACPACGGKSSRVRISLFPREGAGPVPRPAGLPAGAVHAARRSVERNECVPAVAGRIHEALREGCECGEEDGGMQVEWGTLVLIAVVVLIFLFSGGGGG